MGMELGPTGEILILQELVQAKYHREEKRKNVC